MPYRLDVVDAVARAPTRLVRESRPFHDGVVPTQITDVADAMVARQLFDACWDSGLVLVATSNRPPEALYEGGPNRQYFSPFVTRRARGVRRHPYAVDATRLDKMLRAGCGSSVELFVSTGRATIGGCG